VNESHARGQSKNKVETLTINGIITLTNDSERRDDTPSKTVIPQTSDTKIEEYYYYEIRTTLFMPYQFLKKLPYFKNLILRLETLENENQQLKAQCEFLQQQFKNCDCLPLPPPKLMTRAGGGEDLDHFLGVGRKITWDLKKLLAGINKSVDSFPAILDFGCGCGRILRFLKLSPEQMLAGTDIDRAAIAWNTQFLGSLAQFQVNHPLPPLAYPDQHFDFIYSISVFTHLPEPMQFLWLAELKRILKPGGIFIATIRHEHSFPLDQPAARTQWQQEGFYYLKGHHTPGLPKYYQAAFHTQAYLQTHWSQYFNLLSIQPRAINNHQDAVICEKPVVQI